MIPSPFILATVVLLSAPSSTGAIPATFTGTISIGCTDGRCNVTGPCDALSVPGDAVVVNDGGDDTTSESVLSYSNIVGDFILTPNTCSATCDGCVAISGSDTDEGGCIASAGYVYCPELDSCIRPWQENCPFDGSQLVGPIKITCSSGRCNNLSEKCAVESGSAVLGGPYLSDLEGNFTLSDGCIATCQGCSSDSINADVESPTGSPAPQAVVGWTATTSIALSLMGVILVPFGLT
jgi:hypothetical protein